ncbi:GNAT family N-acetyltransferase [Acinetobacter lwoffii]|uniref:GNAT family N-acetyltransferase n=1 Tax=Acinetobacter lwoffii TaxID=28090 RepID=A0AAW8ALY0_ACILW|nr:GNAT family N-acetyltransferase [Acinetobacter lwoffii]MDP1369204.1 GNAT family N-acetyltransferase [Acinetobacter lwoffii]MDP1388658.1 GNAT family N-acetyltransferase [Acinetobacter lwoffii]MDP1446352.1 GNAT family N-acetyltransferase [Acinetobacter lwoffii]
MLVRAATLKDLDTLVDWGKRLTSESPRFKKQGFDEKRARNVFAYLIDKHGSILMVTDEYSNPVGTLIGALDTDWRTGQTLAYEQGLYVLPEYRKSGAASDLIETFKVWADMNKADRIQVGTITGIHADRTVSLYKSLGFEVVGYVLEMEV